MGSRVLRAGWTGLGICRKRASGEGLGLWSKGRMIQASRLMAESGTRVLQPQGHVPTLSTKEITMNISHHWTEAKFSVTLVTVLPLGGFEWSRASLEDEKHCQLSGGCSGPPTTSGAKIQIC